MSGWIKLHRRLRDNPALRDFDAKGVWNDLLLLAQHKPYRDRINGQDVVLQRGQLAIPVSRWCEEGGITRKRMRTILALFVKHGLIKMVQAQGHAATLITICNYDVYQEDDDDKGQAKGQGRAKLGPTRRQEGKKETPSPNGDGPDKPAKSLKGQLWDELLARLEMEPVPARKLVGKWVQAHGIGAVFEAHELAKDREPADYRSYMFGLFKAAPPKVNGRHAAVPPRSFRPQAGEDDPLGVDRFADPFPNRPRMPPTELGAR